jgi:riboflavin synthase
MFTGLIESVGTIDRVEESPAGLRLSVATDLAGELAHGDSLAINGVCLTVVRTSGAHAFADVSPETIRVTTLGALKPGTAVNLERSLRADARVGGHFVQGHVDGTGRIETIAPEGESYRVTVTFPSELEPFVVPKGSIAVDGISLTIAGLDGNRFAVQIIPFTWEHTNLRTSSAGDAVNIECDILGKYVVRALERRGV